MVNQYQSSWQTFVTDEPVKKPFIRKDKREAKKQKVTTDADNEEEGLETVRYICTYSKKSGFSEILLKGHS